MSRGWLLTLLVVLGGCANLEATFLIGPRRVDGNTEAGALIMLSQRFGERGQCMYSHSSNPSKGRPVDDRDDVSVDFAGCGWRFNDR